ncbi:hypothetical protein [Rhodococcus sp. SMB37]|uniref:AMIN-like domain-containing (lipo)protein n=1 Tax=Rhodococcus sp. SMB37 TaxID=2512213 RepID=UPI0018EE7D7D|nr:hypothetical protein [Rhodococcus sp. SMB37]
MRKLSDGVGSANDWYLNRQAESRFLLQASAMSLRLLGITAAVFMTSFGCGNDNVPGSEAPSNSADTQTGQIEVGTPPSTPPTEENSIPRDEGSPPQASGPIVVDIRIETNPEFDRIVYEFDGVGTIAWKAEYVSEAVPFGGGFPLEINSPSIIQVDMMGTSIEVDEQAVSYGVSNPLVEPDAAIVSRLYLRPSAGAGGIVQSVVGGITQSFIGVQGDRPPFRAKVLDHPSSLVLDIATIG